MDWIEIRHLLGRAADTAPVDGFIANLRSKSTVLALPPRKKVYPDITYYDFPDVGISLQFKPEVRVPGVDSHGGDAKTSPNLDCVDIYNSQINTSYFPFPALPLVVSSLEVSTDTTAVEFVRILGEPSRKGGGPGTSSGISIWCEWGHLGLMVEFGGKDAIGPLAWDTGKDAPWKVISIFR